MWLHQTRIPTYWRAFRTLLLWKKISRKWLHTLNVKYTNIIYSGFFLIPAGKQGNFSFEVSCKKIPGGHYYISLFGQQRTGSDIEDGDREILTLNDVYMIGGRDRGRLLRNPYYRQYGNGNRHIDWYQIALKTFVLELAQDKLKIIYFVLIKSFQKIKIMLSRNCGLVKGLTPSPSMSEDISFVCCTSDCSLSVCIIVYQKPAKD